MASTGLWCVACPWHAQTCCALSMCQVHKRGLPCLRERVVRKSSLGCCQRPQLIRACTASKASSEENVGLPNDTGAVGTIAIPPDSRVHRDDRPFELLVCKDSSGNCPEDNEVANRSLSNSVSIVSDDGTRTPSNYYYGDAELLSRSTSVAERSAIALATMAYERAKRLFTTVSANLNDLESIFRKRIKVFGSLSTTQSDAEGEADKVQTTSEESENGFKRLNDQVVWLQQELNDKDQKLQLALMEAKYAHQQLRALHFSSPKVIDIVLDDPSEAVDNEPDESEMKSQEDLLLVEEKVACLLGKVEDLNRLVAGWKNAFNVLQKESQHSSAALQLAAQELVNAQTYIEKHEVLHASEIRKKDAQLVALEGELCNAKKQLEDVLKCLSVAEQQRNILEGQTKGLGEALKHEKDALAATIRSSSSQKEALAVAEMKVAGLTSEVTSLKGLVEGKEEAILTMREEARRNANMLVSAAKTREALLIAEKRIEQLTSQATALEDEVKSRDLVLNDIKEEAVQSTEALRLAAHIKQDLNLSRQREMELSQELEGMKDIVKELRQEVLENNRAVRAEQALRQLENEMDEVTAEVDILRKGVEARDEAIQLMKEEVDRNIDVLSHAAGNREFVRELEEHIEELKAELRKKDGMLAAVSKGDLDGSSPSSMYKSNMYEDSSNYNLPSSSSSPPSQEASKTRKRVNRNTNGYKRTPRQNS